MSLVLIVEESATIRLHLKLLVERLGHTPASAANIDEAVRLLGVSRPDLMIIDLVEYMTHLHKIKTQFTQIPVAVVAHPDEAESARSAESQGVIGVLLHPLDSAAIDDLISRLPSRVIVEQPVVSPRINTPPRPSGLLHLYAHLGHDLRTPLNAILGFSDMLADEVTELGEPSLALDVKRIHGAGERMLAMVDELVDLARADLGQLTLSPQSFPVREAFETLKAEVQADASLPPIEILYSVDSDAPHVITTDARRFRQILATLLKVVRQGGSGPATLLAGRAGENLKITLEAPKFGMTASELNQAIGPLEETEGGLFAKSGGLCLGLALSKRVVDLMKGSLTVSSNNGGIAIQVELPPGQPDSRGETPSARPVDASDVAEATRPLKILLAEDSPVNQSLMRSMLKRIGREADIASNGMEVLAMLRKSHYDLILMDVNMPEMDGLEATRKIQAGWPAEKRPKIVALTGAVNPKDVQACREAGMDDYLAKPIQSPALKAMIESLLV